MADEAGLPEIGRVQQLVNLSRSTWTRATSLVFSVANYSSDKFYLCSSDIEIFGNFFKRNTSRVKENLPMKFKLRLRRDQLEWFINQIRKQFTNENGRDTHLKYSAEFKRSNMLRDSCTGVMDNEQGSSERQVDVLVPLLWTLIVERNSVCSPISEEMKRLRRWNQRVNELDLTKKLGSQEKWKIFEHKDTRLCSPRDEYLHGMADQESTNVGQNKVHVGVIRHTDKFYFTPLNTVEIPPTSKATAAPLNVESRKVLNSDQKLEECCNSISNVKDDIGGGLMHKKHDILHPLKKLFRSSKAEKEETTQKVCTAGQNKFKSTRRTCDNELHQVGEEMRVSKKRSRDGIHRSDINQHSRDTLSKCCNDLQQEPNFAGACARGKGDSEDGLTIQVPGSVQKIVLMKDGRRVTIEL